MASNDEATSAQVNAAMTPAGVAMGVLHDMFTNAMRGGFTEDQALKLLGHYMASIPGAQGE